jgi:hypothetical protein
MTAVQNMKLNGCKRCLLYTAFRGSQTQFSDCPRLIQRVGAQISPKLNDRAARPFPRELLLVRRQLSDRCKLPANKCSVIFSVCNLLLHLCKLAANPCSRVSSLCNQLLHRCKLAAHVRREVSDLCKLAANVCIQLSHRCCLL